MLQIKNFRLATSFKLNDGYSVEERYDTTDIMWSLITIVLLSIPVISFHIFGFLDNTGFWTTAPGIASCHGNVFYDDVQQLFYSAYFLDHGLKVQTFSLANGIVGSVLGGALH